MPNRQHVLVIIIIIIIIIIIPRLLKKSWGYCNCLCPSVHPSRYLLLNHWTEFNQIWCVSCSHKWGVQLHIFWRRPLGPFRGVKRSNIIIFQFQSQFQRFFNQTVFVFSHIKDIKHIRWDFHLAAWVMPQGWDLGVPWGGGGGWGSIFSPKLNLIWCLSYLHEWQMHRPAPFFGSPPPGALGRGQKVN